MKEPFPKPTALSLRDAIEYSTAGVVSRQILKNENGSITLFSFDRGEGLGEHSAPFDALVQIIDGEAEIHIDGRELRLKEGEAVVMPARAPHSLYAPVRFKMLLSMIKK